jgi:hypothetical protein
LNSNTIQKGYGNSASTRISHKDLSYGLNGNQNINANTKQIGVGNTASTSIRSRSSENAILPGAPIVAPRGLPAFDHLTRSRLLPSLSGIVLPAIANPIIL